jgi:hypothetical protein
MLVTIPINLILLYLITLINIIHYEDPQYSVITNPLLSPPS